MRTAIKGDEGAAVALNQAQPRSMVGGSSPALDQITPPLARMVCPFTQPLSGPARNATTEAISWGCPMRPSGFIEAGCSFGKVLFDGSLGCESECRWALPID